MRHAPLVLLLCACAAGEPGPAEGLDGGVAAPVDARPPSGFVDAGDPAFRCDPVDGPAAALLIDDSVHPGGVWNEDMDFRMADHPLGWALATVHASLLLRARCIDLSPSAILAIALKESRLTCGQPGSLANLDGCFQIESTSAFVELQKMFPDRYAGKTHAELIGDAHFETAALGVVHYLLFSTAMFRKYTACPEGFCIEHPDPHTAQKILLGAYNRGLWWNQLPAIFTTCADRDVVDCFAHDVAIDYVGAIVDYTVALDAAPVFDAPIAWSDVEAYWEALRPLYPEVDGEALLASLRTTFDSLRGPDETLSFRDDVRCLLRALIAALPPVASVEDAAAAACGQSYLGGTACEPGAGCPPELTCRDDGPVIE
jgi:hypothetical protein